MKLENNNSLNHIRNHRIVPSASSWIAVKEKLKRNRAKKKINLYRNLAIAASTIAILSIAITYSTAIPVKNGKTFATNHLYQPIILEELPLIKDDPFYAYDKIIQIVPVNDVEVIVPSELNIFKPILEKD